MLALVPLRVVVKVYRHSQEESERQEKEKEKQVCREIGEAWGGGRKKKYICLKEVKYLSHLLQVPLGGISAIPQD